MRRASPRDLGVWHVGYTPLVVASQAKPVRGHGGRRDASCASPPFEGDVPRFQNTFVPGPG
eukprot:201362-Prymnesium_polylepis.1